MIKILLGFFCTIAYLESATKNLEDIMTKERVYTEKAPKAIGPYSQGIKSNNFLFVSGQIPLDPVTSELVEGSIKDQAIQVIGNLRNICLESNSDLNDIVKLTIYLTDLSNFAEVNELMMEYFSEPYPARATVEVSGLPLGVSIEMDAIVSLDDLRLLIN